LIEECRDEEERRSIMMEMDGSSDHKGAKDPVYALAMIDT
jgi:hypothetical protein